MKTKELTFKVPNALICDDALSLSARKVGAVLYGRRNAFGFCKKSIKDIAAIAGLSAATVSKSVDELQRAGYVVSARTYRWSKKRQRMVYGKKVYRCDLHFAGGYTRIPRMLLQEKDLTPAAFCVMLYVYQAAGNRRRAWPSIAKISQAISVSHSTVCRALLQIKKLPSLLVQLCRKTNGAFSASSYYLAKIIDLPNIGYAALEQQGAETVKKPFGLFTYILNALRQAYNHFFTRGVVPNLANYS